MAVVWSNDIIMQLIELFHSKALLWDTSRKEYKDKNKKNDAFEEISQALNIPKKDVETKIHILRTQFSREKKKTKKTTGSGGIEKCKWIYYEPLQFLLCGADPSGESGTMNNTVDGNSVCQSDNNMEKEPPSGSLTPTPNATTSPCSRKRIMLDDFSDIFDIKISAKKKMDDQEKKDPLDVYGAYVAAELKSVKDDQAVTQAKYKINCILYELKMGRYQTATSTQNNVQETVIREIERQEVTQDETEVTAKVGDAQSASSDREAEEEHRVHVPAHTRAIVAAHDALLIKQQNAHKSTIKFDSFSWCDSCWYYPNISKGMDELLLQCEDRLEVELSDDLDELIKRSKAFPIPFPIETNRLETLKARRPIEKLKKNIVSTYPLIHERVLLLMTQFLLYKREFGSSIEKELYKDMGVPQFIDRVLKKRAVAVSYMLMSGTSNNVVVGRWSSVGTEDERPPLLLENCLSYDEMKLSALVFVSGHTECINDGERFNAGVIEEEDIETHAVIIGVVGPKIERQSRMDYEDILITEEQNVPENGYGLGVRLTSAQSMWRHMWADFYQVDKYTYEMLTSKETIGSDKDATSKYIDRFVKLSNSSHVFDNEVYYKRIRILAETVLIEADERGRMAEKMAYVNVIGPGLGTWIISEHQSDVYVLTVTKCVMRLLYRKRLQNVSKVNFAYITPSDSVLAMFPNSSDSGSEPVRKIFFENDQHPNGGITVQIQTREPSSKLTGEDEGKLLVMTYAGDANAPPGNDFWFGRLIVSGDSAAASSTQIPELHNAHVNRAVCAARARVAGRHGLRLLRQQPFDILDSVLDSDSDFI